MGRHNRFDASDADSLIFDYDSINGEDLIGNVVDVYFETSPINKVIAEMLICLGADVLYSMWDLLEVIEEYIYEVLGMTLDEQALTDRVEHIAGHIYKLATFTMNNGYGSPLTIVRWYKNSVMVICE